MAERIVELPSGVEPPSPISVILSEAKDLAFRSLIERTPEILRPSFSRFAGYGGSG